VRSPFTILLIVIVTGLNLLQSEPIKAQSFALNRLVVKLGSLVVVPHQVWLRPSGLRDCANWGSETALPREGTLLRQTAEQVVRPNSSVA